MIFVNKTLFADARHLPLSPLQKVELPRLMKPAEQVCITHHGSRPWRVRTRCSIAQSGRSDVLRSSVSKTEEETIYGKVYSYRYPKVALV